MEFLEGRIFDDVRLLSLSPEDRYKWYFFLFYYIKKKIDHNCSLTRIFFSWYSAIDTLAKLHSVDYKAIGLENYGKSSGFYSRQFRSLVKVSTIQANIKDENGNEVGPLPRLDDMIRWFKKNEVDDETTVVHGDFKVKSMLVTL